MNTKRRTEIQLRWNETDAELEDIRNGKVTRGSDPATREGELLEKIDGLEFEFHFMLGLRHPWGSTS